MATRSALALPAATGWRWAVLGALLGILVAVALWAPARWLADALAGWTGGRLQLVNPRGTVWNGQAGVVLETLDKGYRLDDRVLRPARVVVSE